MQKIPQPYRIAILCIAAAALLFLAVFGIIMMVRSTPDPVPVMLESEIPTEPTTEAPYLNKERKPVPACTYDLTQLINEDGIFTYSENGTVTSALGIDVSAHQQEIHWDQVAAAGVQFAFIRIGYRGYESGKLIADDFFEQNMQGALDAGLDVGVYLYSQAISTEEAIEEAEFALSMIEGYEISYPVVYDWEVVANGPARTDRVSDKTLTDCTIAFCETIRSAGYTPMFYQNKAMALDRLDLEVLTDYEFWLAEYDDLPSYPYHYDIWQYTAKGSIPGIEGDVDLNICFRDYTNEEQ